MLHDLTQFKFTLVWLKTRKDILVISLGNEQNRLCKEQDSIPFVIACKEIKNCFSNFY